MLYLIKTEQVKKRRFYSNDVLKRHGFSNLIFDVEGDDEDEDDCVIESGDFRIAYDAVHRHEQEGRGQRAQDADRVTKGHQLFGGRGSQLFEFNRNKMVKVCKSEFSLPTKAGFKIVSHDLNNKGSD